MKPKYLETPWIFKELDRVENESYGFICSVRGDSLDAPRLAKHIVHVVNCHDDLLEALESVRSLISDAARTGFTDKEKVMKVYESNKKTSEAINKAKIKG